MTVIINGVQLVFKDAAHAARAALKWRSMAEVWEPGSSEREHCLLVAEAAREAARLMVAREFEYAS